MRKDFIEQPLITETEKSFTLDDLQFAIEMGYIEPDAIQNFRKMAERKKYLAMHKNEIWQDKEGRWGTYLPGSNGRIQKVRKNKEDLLDDIVKFYKVVEKVPTIEEVFYEWLNYKVNNEGMKKQTYDRYLRDFNRFFVKKNLHLKKIKDVNKIELEDFIRSTIYKDKLSIKAWGGLRLLLKGIYWHAERYEYTNIDINAIIKGLALSKKTFTNKYKDDFEEIFTEEELVKLAEYFALKPTLQHLGILLALYTGMRVGEISALKHEDIFEDFIFVRRMQVNYKDENGKTVYEVVDNTKTDAGTRKIVIIDEVKQILKAIKKMSFGKEYLFQDENGIKSIHVFTMALYRACDKVGIPRKSMHKMRKTYATALIDAGIPESVITDQLGHSQITTTKMFYYYNKMRRNQMQEAIGKAIGKAINF